MKLRNIIIILTIVVFLVLTIVNKDFEKLPKLEDYKINESLFIEIYDGKNYRTILYNFNNDTFSFSNSDKKNNLLKNNLGLLKNRGFLFDKGELFLDNKKVFECNYFGCDFIVTKDYNYLIFIDDRIYKEKFIKKVLANNGLRIFDTKKLLYKDVSKLTDGKNDLNLIQFK